MGFDRKFFTSAAALLAIILTVAGGYWVWNGFFSEAGKARRLVNEQVEFYEKAEKAYVEAMTADTYGGKTPQETLDLFVSALEKEDIDLASKYFLLDENLSREKWVVYLQGVKERNLLATMARDIKYKTEAGNLNSDNEFCYILRNNDGTVGIQIDLRLNK